jgi:hypothetical protein
MCSITCGKTAKRQCCVNTVDHLKYRHKISNGIMVPVLNSHIKYVSACYNVHLIVLKSLLQQEIATHSVNLWLFFIIQRNSNKWHFQLCFAGRKAGSTNIRKKEKEGKKEKQRNE